MDKLYTISEIADKLNLSPKTLRRWEESGKFTPSRTLGGQRRYSLLDLQILDAIKHNTIPNSSDLLTIDGAANLFGVTPTTITRWENEGRIHPLITAGITYYPRHRLLEKLSELTELIPTHTSPQPPSFHSESDLVIKSTTRPLSNPTFESKIPSTTSKVSPPPQPKTPNTLSMSPDFHTASFIANLTVTLILILTYHLIFINPNSSQFRGSDGNSATSSPPPLAGLVQGSATNRDPSLTLLDSILDPTGALTTKTSLTTPQISLVPAPPPAGATPGTLYFDASSQTLKLFTTTWNDLPGPQTLQLSSTSLLSGNGTILKGKDTVTIDQTGLDSTSSITVTFNSDFAPAKKYWLTTAPNSFTVHTDFPVSANAPFSYLILTPSPSPSIEPTPSPSTKPSPTPPLIESPSPAP